MLYVFLDLDNTLISSEPTDQIDEDREKEKMERFVFHRMDDEYIVFERPGVQEFLSNLFASYSVSVWTAASKEYGEFVITNVILKDHPERHLDGFLWSKHCKESKRNKCGAKDLTRLWTIHSLKHISWFNVILIDDLNDTCRRQPFNCVHVKPFEYTSKESWKDQELARVSKRLFGPKPFSATRALDGICRDDEDSKDDQESAKTAKTATTKTMVQPMKLVASSQSNRAISTQSPDQQDQDSHKHDQEN
jgi:NLI interacting factor-like phosphatase